MTKIEQEQLLKLFEASSRVGVGCRTTGATLLGSGVGDLYIPNEREIAHKEGTVNLENRLAIRVGSLGWSQLNTPRNLPIGSVVSVGTNYSQEQIAAKSKESHIFNPTLQPAIVVDRHQDGSPVLVVASPSDKRHWTVNTKEGINEYQDAIISLKRLLGGGLELEHMITQIVATILKPDQDNSTLDIYGDVHSIHANNTNAKKAVARNILRGRAKLSLLLVNDPNSWIFVDSEKGIAKPDHLRKELTHDEKITVLSSGLTVASYQIHAQAGLSNTQIGKDAIGARIAEYGVAIADKKTDTRLGEAKKELVARLNKSQF